ncbi:hypothetical protein ABT173_02860 [Streptomyces sp. NPDC001795]|uniref:hypothetical protein n=1 Tax=unclassified Streptomyces TaxID=2593676 RepID=UPI00333370DC
MRHHRTTRACRSLTRSILSVVGAAALAVSGAASASAASPAAGPRPPGPGDHVTTRFNLFPNRPFLQCLSGSNGEPRVTAEVKRGKLNDELRLRLTGFKPDLDFDLFTVQNSNQLANGAPNPAFRNFGLAWYQSDIHTNSRGDGEVRIRTILLDQIFGFDPEVALQPTNTFHVGFWFNNPADAQPCGFNGPPTPFNGEHQAGPLAFITRPDANTDLGPLCTKPDTSTTPPHCNP